MPRSLFTSADQLESLINSYFNSIGTDNTGNETNEGPETKPKRKGQKTSSSEPATIAGLILYLGFRSKEAFEDYEARGKYRQILKWGRLRVEAVYEKKLHDHQSAAGAIFALKNSGWREKQPTADPTEKSFKNLKIEVTVTGPKPANNERDVVL